MNVTGCALGEGEVRGNHSYLSYAAFLHKCDALSVVLSRIITSVSVPVMMHL